MGPQICEGTSNCGLLYKKSEVEGYCDSDYSRDLDIIGSLTGYLFTLFDNIVS